MKQDFKAFYDQQPDNHKQLLDACNINSFNLLSQFAQKFGVNNPDYHEMIHELLYQVGLIKLLPNLKDMMQYFDSILEHDKPNNDDEYFSYKDAAEQEDFDYTDEEDDDYSSALPERYILDRNEVQEYHIRIKLNDSPFPIWREIKIPSNVTLEFFAFIIIEAMGWYNEHLHCFRTKNHTFKNTFCIKEDEKFNQMFDGSVKSLNTNDYTISDILIPKGKRITFKYDFGDGWEHDVWVKGARPYEQEEPTITFVKGKGTCPPENCGGVGGYAYLIDIWLKNRKKKEEKEQLDFYGMHPQYNFDDIDAEGAQEVFDFLWQTAKNK